MSSLGYHTSVVLYYAKKTTEKQLLILEFHTPSSPWRYTTPDTTARSLDSTGQIFLVFDEIYRVGDSARCLINFVLKGILDVYVC
jgi:hypothetical protein